MIDGSAPRAARLRRARPEDAPALTTLGRSSFTAAFGHLYPPSDLEAFVAAAHTPKRYLAWIADPDCAVWIAEQEIAVGYALAGHCDLPHPEVTADCGELKRIYLSPQAQGQGLGTALLDTALGWLARPGRQLWIGVWSENHRAQRLYASRGFHKVGEYQFAVGECRDREFILRRDTEAPIVSSARAV